MLRILVVSLLLLVAAMLLLPRPRDVLPATETATVVDAPLPLPAFSLVDSAGQPFTDEDLRGGHHLVFFGFTHCPDICPLTLTVLRSVREQIAAQAPAVEPGVVFVSVDPQRDTPSRIREYLNNFDSSFVGVTGSEVQLEPLVKALGVTVHKTEVDGERYNVVHNGTIYVIGPDAALVAVFGGSDHDARAVVSDYLRIRGIEPAQAAL